MYATDGQDKYIHPHIEKNISLEYSVRTSGLQMHFS